jgi:hypothetical protein
MPYVSKSVEIGVQPINLLETTASPLHQVGSIIPATDATLGSAEFIYLRIPASTAVPLGTVVQWNSAYTIAVLPVLATSKNTGVKVAVNVTAIASNTSVQFGWFQIQGAAVVLKTAVQVTPTGVPVYASATAGRIKLLTSAGGQITGMRTFNAATVTTTTSTVTVFLDRPSMQGQIT